MKKITTTLSAIVLTFNSFAQITIEKSVDEMTDETSYIASERFMCANERKTKGFVIDMIITKSKGVFMSEHMLVQAAGLGGCNEENTMIILFENSERITLKSWNDFNCDGLSYFTATQSHIEKLKSIPIAKVRLTNERSNESYTSENIQKNYFIEFYQALKIK